MNPATTTIAAPANATPDKAAPSVRLGDTLRQERKRLLAFIRRRLPDAEDAEDLLQDVFVELAEAVQLAAQPIERVGAWLFAVARHKISDYYRSPNHTANTVSLDAPAHDDNPETDAPLLTDYLALSSDNTPDNLLFRETLMDALATALDELPDEQRDVFVRHELEGQSFRAMADELGVPINTLLARKRYAVLRLRIELRDLYEDFLNE
jgi:RNA polymerase sigma factor (sigma-70 family)